MSEGKTSFILEEEAQEKIKNLAKKCNAVMLCLIAPFAPIRVTPSRSVFARFSYPDEFVLEDFIDMISEKYPKKEERPPLYLLIHSPGGTVSSSYVVARVLRDHFNNIISFVPHIAASGAAVIALCSNEIIMGNISRLTGIDPFYEVDDETVYPLSVVRAFDLLEDYFRTKTLEEAAYPYQHMVNSITAQLYDQSTHALGMVEGYTKELMSKAGYEEKEIKKVIRGMLYDIKTHEEIIMFDRLKQLGVKVKHFSEDSKYADCWKAMKEWLRMYYMKPSPIHITKYCLPGEPEKVVTEKSTEAKRKPKKEEGD